MKTKPDFIVVGSGVGGATLGHALAQSGAQVVFLEKGASRLNNDKMLQGSFAETYAHQQINKDWQQTLKLSGRFFSPLQDVSNQTKQNFIPFIGSGGGGGSSLYGAVMERFKPEDFIPQANYPDTQGNACIPEKWPICYQELEPYYDRAEQLYRVRNCVDDSKSGSDTAISEPNRRVWKRLTQNGYHPYQLPTATDSTEHCLDNCQSYLCARNCKNDSEKVALRPAVEKHQAQLLDNCEVLEIERDGKRIISVTCLIAGEYKRLEADCFILAAGALSTPALLLKSNNLANSSDLVGKYLMRHLVDLFVVKMDGFNKLPESQKQIGFNDFYLTDEGKFGAVQSFGLMPPLEVVIQELRNTLPFNLGKIIAPVMDALYPIIASGYSGYFNNRLVFASIMEDLPILENQVRYQDQQIQIHYKINDIDLKRAERFRAKVLAAFNPLPVTVMKQSTNNQRIAHACGTCRFGDDPARSVLDRFNKTHDLDNLYVVDASFFPTSGGINPSLTIAANALRVADAILSERPTSV